MMGWTLGQYLFRRYIVIMAWLFVGTFALIFIIDFAEFSSRTSSLPAFTLPLSLAIIGMRVPMFMQQTVPFIALLATMVLLVNLNRRSELVIIRAAGISVWRFLLPLGISAFLFGLLIILVFNPLAAAGLASSQLYEANMRASSPSSTDVVPWMRQKAGNVDTIIGARASLNQGTELADASFFTLDENQTIGERLDADRAYLRDGYWELVNVERFREGSHESNIASVNIPTNLRPEFVQERLATPETISIYQLPSTIRVAQSFGLRANAFAMQFHYLLALPPLLVAMTIIAATVSLRFTRTGISVPLILSGIVAGFLLYVVSVLVKAFGSSGIVPPVVAAWFPVLIAMFFGVTYLLYREDG
ncbi:MAG: LPS export ABC transporter permease LptG [Rhizobiaceae bacterium]